ncbi:MAG: nucleoside 2-deoxyribosyltransferase domain-containing protein [Acidobacteriota bacterium]
MGLYGTAGTAWRQACKNRLETASIPWHDPTDTRWDSITHDNGDTHQELIDILVAEEHRALEDARCIIFHLRGGAEPSLSLAARCELGWLAAADKPAFVHIEYDALGRNYLWSVVKLYPHLTTYSSLEKAVDSAIGFMTSDH